MECKSLWLHCFSFLCFCIQLMVREAIFMQTPFYCMSLCSDSSCCHLRQPSSLDCRKDSRCNWAACSHFWHTWRQYHLRACVSFFIVSISFYLHQWKHADNKSWCQSWSNNHFRNGMNICCLEHSSVILFYNTDRSNWSRRDSFWNHNCSGGRYYSWRSSCFQSRQLHLSTSRERGGQLCHRVSWSHWWKWVNECRLILLREAIPFLFLLYNHTFLLPKVISNCYI